MVTYSDRQGDLPDGVAGPDIKQVESKLEGDALKVKVSFYPTPVSPTFRHIELKFGQSGVVRIINRPYSPVPDLAVKEYDTVRESYYGMGDQGYPTLGVATDSYTSNSLTLSIPLASIQDLLGESIQVGVDATNSSYLGDTAPDNSVTVPSLLLPTTAPRSGTSGADQLTGGSFRDTLSGLAGNDTLTGKSSTDRLMGGDGADTINAGGGNDIAMGGLGDDKFEGGDGDDTIYGDDGNDKITDTTTLYTTGTDKIYGGVGNDTIAEIDPYNYKAYSSYIINKSDQVYGGQGDDVISGSGKLDGGVGNDRISGVGRLEGGTGDDRLDGEFNRTPPSRYAPGGTPGDEFFGGGGKDTIYAGNGSDLLDGGSGDDYLVGGIKGDFNIADTLTGGSGRDTFVLGDATSSFYGSGDTYGTFAKITDFAPTQDIIQLKGSADYYELTYDAASSTATLTSKMSLPEIGLSPGGVATLQGNVATLSLTGSYFSYVYAMCN